MKPRRTILLVSHGAALGGSPISCLSIARMLRSEFNFCLAFGEEGPIAQLARAEGFTVAVLPKTKGWVRWLGLLNQYRALLHGVDLVHLNTLTSYYKYPALAARLAKKPVVWFVRENPEEKRCLRLLPYLRHLARRVVTVSHDTARHLPLPPAQLATIWNGVDLTRFQPQPNVDLRALPGNDGRVLFGVVASLEPRKGVLETIQAFAGIQASRYRLYIVGRDRSPSGCYGQEVAAKIKSLGLEENVVLLGEKSDMAPFMNAIDVFILFSGWEGLARTILEAMACGRPVIASRCGGNPEQVEDGVNGLLVDYPEPAGLTCAIQRYLDVPTLLSAHGVAARRLAEERFDLTVASEKIRFLYEGVISEPMNK